MCIKLWFCVQLHLLSFAAITVLVCGMERVDAVILSVRRTAVAATLPPGKWFPHSGTRYAVLCRVK
jgi:hypothetical protein